MKRVLCAVVLVVVLMAGCGEQADYIQILPRESPTSVYVEPRLNIRSNTYPLGSEAVNFLLLNWTSETVKVEPTPILEVYRNNKWEAVEPMDAVFSSTTDTEYLEGYLPLRNYEPLDIGSYRLTFNRLNESGESEVMRGEFSVCEPLIEMEIVDGTLTSDKCTVRMTNLTNGDFTFGSDFVLDKKADGGWIQMDTIHPRGTYGSTMEGYGLSANRKVEWEVTWVWLHGSLPPGEYRVGKGFHNLPGGAVNNYHAYAEFTIE